MKKNILMVVLISIGNMGWAETVNEPEQARNIFAASQSVQRFTDEQQLLEYIKVNKPSTFRYYDRLDQQAKKQVFKKHQENQTQDITEIVLLVYRKHR